MNNKHAPDKLKPIRPEMTVLDVISRYRQTESIFRQYDKQAGECICCQALFDPLQDIVNLFTAHEAQPPYAAVGFSLTHKAKLPVFRP